MPRLRPVPSNRKQVQIAATPVFYQNMYSEFEVNVNRGGARSTKSYSIAQILSLKAIQEKQKKILIVRKSLPPLRISTLFTFKDVLGTMGVTERFREEKVGLNYWYKGNLIHFGSVDDPEKIKSSEWNYIWIEEATEFSYEDYKQLKLRLSNPSVDGKKNQMYLSFNPTDEFCWIKEKVLDEPTENTLEIVSTYRDNPFLSADYVKIIENLQYQDQNYWRIYGLGEWGRLEHVIYSNYDFCPAFPQDLKDIIYGLDFGYNAESAMLKIGIKGMEVWEEEVIYSKCLTNQDLIARMNKVGVDKRYPIYCDNAEPDRIEELKRAGYKARGCTKSTMDSIDFVKRLKIHQVETSSNLTKERRSFSWKTNKNGDPLDEPVEFMDHLMDCERYGLYTHLRKFKEYRIRWVA